jgi:hypothetical protein
MSAAIATVPHQFTILRRTVMASLTVSEKTFWKERIAARIERRVEAIRAQHPALFDRVRRAAHVEALRSLGLEACYAELEAVKEEAAALARRKKAAQRAMVATLRGVPIDEVSDSFSIRYGNELPLPHEAADAITKRQSVHQTKLLADDPVGCEIARLEGERERLLDVVWLATSPSEVKQLWLKVGVLLGDESTRLERDALAIAPGKEE